MEKNNNDKKRWGRRVGSVIGAVVLTTVAYYIVMFKGMELSWWVEYSKTITLILGLLVGGLTVTDVVGKMKS